MTTTVTILAEGQDLAPSLTGLPPRGVIHRVALTRLMYGRIDLAVELDITAGRAEQLADVFAEIAATIRQRDDARAAELRLGAAVGFVRPVDPGHASHG